jgi:hypothetical protein
MRDSYEPFRFDHNNAWYGELGHGSPKSDGTISTYL